MSWMLVIFSAYFFAFSLHFKRCDASSSTFVSSPLHLPENSTDSRRDQRSFDGFSVLRLIPTSDVQLEFLKKLSLTDQKLDFWTRPTVLNESVDVMVPPQEILRLEKSLRRLNMEKLLMIDDVERVVKKERQILQEDMSSSRPLILEESPHDSLSYRTPSIYSSPQSFFEKYQRVDQISDFLDSIVNSYPEIASTLTLGKSYEGRDLKAIKIGTPPLDARSKKPIIYVDGGLHAREWVSVSTALFLAHKLTQDYQVDPEVTRILQTYDFYIHPVANPDGYEWTHTRDRLWRKTRSRTGLSIFGCRGVDPNRNFDFHWNEVGASDSPCTDVFAGHRPFSEPETRAIADFVMSKKDQIKAFIALHSYSQVWLTPWGYTGKLPENYSKMESVGKKAAGALSRKFGTHYRVGSATNILYAAAGGADDWAHGVAGIPYVYTVELRDTGRYGFLLPRDQIVPTGEEFFDALKEICSNIS